MGEDLRLLTASVTVHLGTPVDLAWSFLTDLPNTGLWRERMAVRWIEPGKTFEVTTSFGPWRKMTLTGEVTSNDTMTRFAYRIVEGPLKAQNEYLLEPEGHGTRFTMAGGAAKGAVTRAFGPVIRLGYNRTTTRELRRLQELPA